jgi:diacylglycerol kinase family enzyme
MSVALGERVELAQTSTLQLGAQLPLLLNSAAGSTPGASLEELTELFREAGVAPQIEVVEPAQLARTVRKLAESGVAAVAVGGGDGSISTAADALAGTSTILIPVPLGTLNHFATRYGLATVAAVAHALQSGTVITIPIGTVNDRHFVNNASCGFYAHMVRTRERLRPYLSKWPAAVIAALIVLARRPVLEVTVIANGTRVQRRTTAAWIGIGRHSLRLPEPGDATKEGHVLEIVLPRPLSRWALLELALRAWYRLRRHQKVNLSELEILRAPEIDLVSRHSIDIATDGEVQRMAGPLHFSYRAAALRVLCLVRPETD